MALLEGYFWLAFGVNYFKGNSPLYIDYGDRRSYRGIYFEMPNIETKIKACCI